MKQEKHVEMMECMGCFECDLLVDDGCTAEICEGPVELCVSCGTVLGIGGVFTLCGDCEGRLSGVLST